MLGRDSCYDSIILIMDVSALGCADGKGCGLISALFSEEEGCGSRWILGLKEVEVYGDFWVSVISALFYFVRLTLAITTSPLFLSSLVGLFRSQERLQAMVCVCARGRDKDVLCM
ncbi:hypothetical protein POTOM_028226 [Populus tomentosa]|uniref:Uncharacterized protein n=1 Tax=Populus tomentosa TaxID=118781 RepID=A0A8X8CUR8_POPTO|nr:hypothetical protein POTOM_028226 [Populus tomentosa]